MTHANQLEFYIKEVQSQWDGVSWMISGGLHIDTAALIAHRRAIDIGIRTREANLTTTLGWTPNTKSGPSMEKLFDQIGVRPSRTKPTSRHPKGSAQHGEDDLLGYMHRFPSSRDVLTLCREITSMRTLRDNFLDLALDTDDYYHPTYGLNATATGRYASRGADEGGPQGQNWPHQLLNIVIPDQPGDILIEADLKQAEDMIIAWDAEDLIAIDAFNRNIDSHRLKACWAFRNWDYARGLPPTELLQSITEVCPKCSTLGEKKCTHSERFISKSSGYAFKYMMGVRKYITKQLPKAGVFISEIEGKRIRDRIVSPPTKRWQDETLFSLRKSRWLTNLLGRKREFYGLLDETGEMLRAALSWKAQSVVGVIAGRAVSRLERSLRLINRARLLTQRHDSVLVSLPPSELGRVQDALQEAFYSPIVAHGRKLNIPLEFKTGPNWRDLN